MSGTSKRAKKLFRPRNVEGAESNTEGSATNYSSVTAFLTIFAGALVAAWFAFLPSLSGPFIFDDFALPFGKPHAGTMPASFWIGGVRPVLMASYWLNFLLSGQSPLPYHVLNLCLHALATALVYLCALSVLKTAGITEDKQRILAIFVSGIFLLHPLQTESVDYIAGRSEVLTGVFFFAAFAVFLRAPGTRIGFGRVLAILALFGAALLSKEHAVSLPALLMFTGFFWNEEGGMQSFRKFARLYACVVALAAIAFVIVVRLLAGASSAGFYMADPLWYEYFLTECRVVPIYLRLFLVPIGQNADWALPFSHGLFDRGAAFYLLALGIALSLAIRYRRRAPLFVYGFLVFLLLLAPTSSVVPIRDAVAERRMYLPIFGLALSAAAILGSLKLADRTLTTGVIVLLSVLGLISYHRSGIWENELAFWGDVVRKSPSNVRAYGGLGAALVKEKRCGAAVDAYEKGIALANPGTERSGLTVPFASALVCDNQPVRAREVVRGVEAPGAAEVFGQLGVAAAKAGHGQQGLSDFNEAIRLDSGYAEAYAYRGLVELTTGDAKSAGADFGHALSLDSNNTVALEGLERMRNSR